MSSSVPEAPLYPCGIAEFLIEGKLVGFYNLLQLSSAPCLHGVRTVKALILLFLMAVLGGCRRAPEASRPQTESARKNPPLGAAAAEEAVNTQGHPVYPARSEAARALTKQPVVGVLGLPLGTVAEIQANIVAGRETGLKQYQATYLLRVAEVDGGALTPPALMEFRIPALWV